MGINGTLVFLNVNCERGAKAWLGKHFFLLQVCMIFLFKCHSTSHATNSNIHNCRSFELMCKNG